MDVKDVLENRGSATLEMTLIMPAVVVITFMVIMLFMDLWTETSVQNECYTKLYQYPERVNEVKERDNEIYISFSDEDNNLDLLFSCEYNECSKRLRRWQFYGDKGK